MDSAILLLSFLFINAACADFLSSTLNVKFDDGGRPILSFIGEVRNGFNHAHGSPFGQEIKPSLVNSDLCHTYPWGAMRKRVNYFMENYWNNKISKMALKNELDRFTKLIFEEDNEAVVNYHYMNIKGKKNPNIEHIDYMEKGTDDSKTLVDVNNKIEKDVLAIINEIDISKNKPQETSDQLSEILRGLFSAPANLRYGHATTNQFIKDAIDLMGNSNNMVTTKEKALIADLTNLDTLLKQNVKSLAPQGTEPKVGSYMLSSNGRYVNTKKYRIMPY